MVVCKYFLQGCCNFGTRCRFEHPQGGKPNNYGGGGGSGGGGGGGGSGSGWNGNRNYNRNQSSNFTLRSSQFGSGDSAFPYKSPMTFGGSGNNRFAPVPAETKHVTFSVAPTMKEIQQVVAQDIDQWERGNQWLFSCYAPLKEAENFPGFEDMSPEELRWNAYQAQTQGTLENYKQEVLRLEHETRPKRQSLKNPTPQMLEILQRIFKREKIPENMFGQLPKENSLGSSPKSDFQFKLPQQQSSNPPPLFTSQVFGNAAAAPPNPTLNPGFFPSQVNPMMASNAGLNPNPGGFGLPVNQMGNMMTAPPNNTNPMGFGVPVPNVAPPSNAPSNFSFKLPSQTFASAAPQQRSNPIPSTIGMGSAFSSPQNTSLFGASPDASASAAGSSIYTPLANLTEEEKQAFEAQTFTLGKVPENPPPIEMCR